MAIWRREGFRPNPSTGWNKLAPFGAKRALLNVSSGKAQVLWKGLKIKRSGMIKNIRMDSRTNTNAGCEIEEPDLLDMPIVIVMATEKIKLQKRIEAD